MKKYLLLAAILLTVATTADAGYLLADWWEAVVEGYLWVD